MMVSDPVAAALARPPRAPDLVSVVIPVHNRAHLVEEAVASALAQTHRPIEVLVVDDGSDDDTPARLAALAARHPGEVRVLRQGRAGPGPARNLGLRHAAGAFVQFLDSDDLLRPRKVSAAIALLAARPDRDACYCATLRPAVGAGPAADTGVAFEVLLPDFLSERGWHTLSPLWRREACARIGGFDDLAVLEDWVYDCRAGLAGIRVVHCPEPLAEVRDGPWSRASAAGADTVSADRLAAAVTAHERVADALARAGRGPQTVPLAFVRRVFHLARQSGAAGETAAAGRALALARALGRGRRGTADIAAYRIAVAVLGWTGAARLGEPLAAAWRGMHHRWWSSR